jgi:hypothetical protein
MAEAEVRAARAHDCRWRPAQDPDSPPYAAPMAYRAVPVHEDFGRRWEL